MKKMTKIESLNCDLLKNDTLEKLKRLQEKLIEVYCPKVILLTRQFKVDIVWALTSDSNLFIDYTKHKTLFGYRFIIAEIETDFEVI